MLRHRFNLWPNLVVEICSSPKSNFSIKVLAVSPWPTKMRRTTTIIASLFSPTRRDHWLMEISWAKRVMTSQAFRAREQIWDRASWVCSNRAIIRALIMLLRVNSLPIWIYLITQDQIKHVTTVHSQILIWPTHPFSLRVIRICLISSCIRNNISNKSQNRIKPYYRK